MVENCAVCGKKLGGVFGLVAAEETTIQELREHGISVPTPICYACSLPYIQELKSATEQAQPQIEIPDIPVFTFNPYNISEYESVSILSAHTLLAVESLMASMQPLDVVVIEQAQVAEDATRICLEKLKVYAGAVGADCVAGVQVSYTPWPAGGNVVLVSMTGTALKRRAASG